ncbi:MAG: DUF2142 domain-containing protein [Methanobrevibacter sp.]|nr:DUF2142 domain-containing protein [Methanobrevibacter sp.]
MENMINILNKNKKLILFYCLTIFLLVLIIFNYENYISPFKEVLIIFILLIEGIFSIIYFKKNYEELHKVAFSIILIFGITCLLLTPIFIVNDEAEHFFRVDSLSEGVLIPEFNNITKNYTVSQTSKDLGDTERKIVTFLDSSATSTQINNSPAQVDKIFSQNPFYGYISSAIGLKLAKILNLTEIFALWFARFFNLLMYASFAYIAIKKAPILKMPLLVCSCIPLAIYQSSSVSIDAFVYGISLIIIGYFLYLYKSKPKSIKIKNIILFFSLITLLSLIKPNYVIFAFLILLVPRDKYENEKYFFISMLGIILTLTVTVAYAKFYSIDSLNNSIRTYMFEQHGTNPQEQLKYISTHIKETLILFSTLIYEVPKLMLKMFNLSYNFYFVDYTRGKLLSVLYYLFFGFVCLFYPLYIKIRNIDRLKLLLITITIIVGTYFIQLLTWAGVGNFEKGVVWGVHLRYFIPLFTLMPLILNINSKNIKKDNLDNYLFIALLGFMAAIPLYITALFY